MKNSIVIIPFAIVAMMFVGCQPSQASIQTAMAQTQESYTPTPKPTSTLKPTETPIPTPTSRSGSLERPVKFKARATVTITESGNVDSFDISIVDVIRGESANELVTKANMFNDAPPQGMEYIFIKVSISLLKGKLNVTLLDFQLATNGQLFDAFSPSVCCTSNLGYPELEANMILPGATTEGWIIRPVFLNDKKPFLVYGVGYDNDLSNAIFFSLAP